MVTAIGIKFILLTICLVLARTVHSAGEDSKPHTNSPQNVKRSLNNYVVTSIPYMIDNKSITTQRPSEWHHNIFSNSPLHNEKQISSDFAPYHQKIEECIGGEIHCIRNVSSEPSSVEPTFQPYSQDELNKILEKYEREKLEPQESNNVATYYNAGNTNNIDSSLTSRGDQHDKSKSWNLIGSQGYNKGPYDDRMGWVTLEPIAWSSSQVQKWEPNQKPMWPAPAQASAAYWNSVPQQQQLQPSYSMTTDRPWKKPTYQYQQKPWSSNQNYGKPPPFPSNPDFDIITDGQPGYFPSDRPSGTYKPWIEQKHEISYSESTIRPSTQISYHVADRQPSNSAGGDGHWVLLSSTKGYSVPHRQRNVARSLDAEDEQESKPKPKTRPQTSKRTVRLTVLPPLPGTTKTETSHGGMIEVESTRQTVDEAHREHVARMMRFKNDSSFNEVRNNNPEFRMMPPKAESLQSNKKSALLAAVSAGMIPATMAMLLPLLIGRKKRSIPEPQPLSRIVNLNFKKLDTPGIVTRYTRSESQDYPKKKIFTKSYTMYQ